MRRGRAAGAGARLPQATLEHNFARHYDLPPAGELTLAGGQRVAYTGQALGPEYFIVTAPGADFGAESAFAVALRAATDRPGARGQAGARQ